MKNSAIPEADQHLPFALGRVKPGGKSQVYCLLKAAVGRVLPASSRQLKDSVTESSGV